MQQGKALYFLIFLNFIAQKQKKLQITSNVRIGLDLFELFTNYGLQTADKAITGCTKITLRYFGQFPAR